jgi:hypothetical protein
MKSIIAILAVVSAVSFYQRAYAVVYRQSQIIVSGTGNLGNDVTTGLAEGWGNTTSQITVTNGSGSLDGTALGLVASAGDKAFISATTALNTRNQFVPSGTFPATTTDTNIYFSFLYKFNSVTDADGKLLVRMNVGTSGTSTPQFWDLWARTVAGQIQLGIAKPTGNVTNYATTNISAGQTIFVVVRHHMIPDVQNDIIDLWINPPADSFYTNEANVPTPSASVGALATDGSEVSTGSGPGRFVLVAGANAQFDEFRAASTWAEVTPFFGQCLSAGIAISPVSQTNVAEIADTFAVFASGTSPTYQWQISGPGSSTWTNISGATVSSYTTPNLALAADNGNKYRTIVTVPCDGTSATSAVATVTITPPTVTPAGLVVDDLFSASIAEPITPITISNAAWYTSTSANLDIFHGGSPGAPMTAYPTSGSSSLWLAYFTPTNNLPVHLAVGNTIKVTFPFIPSSFNSHTNNASLRIGLFNYADKGTRITNDDSTVSGSAGNGINVSGYMLSLDFGPTFTASSPLSVLARNNLNDVNLMGTTSDYLSLGSGPSGGGYSTAPAFQAGVQYDLVFSVTRTAVNSVTITNSITGGGTNWTFSVTETNLAYHRFDAFAIRPNSLETAADSFNIPEFKVEVLAGPASPTSIVLGSVSSSGNSVTLSWTPTPSGSFSYTVQRKINLTDTSWTTLQTGILTTTYTDTTATGNTGFYQVTSP